MSNSGATGALALAVSSRLRSEASEQGEAGIPGAAQDRCDSTSLWRHGSERLRSLRARHRAGGGSRSARSPPATSNERDALMAARLLNLLLRLSIAYFL